jgi:hypothetical protein
MKTLLLILLLAIGINAQTLSIPTMYETPGEVFTVGVELHQPSGIIAYQFHISTEVARPISCSSAVESFAVVCNVDGNTMHVSGYSGYELEESGVLLNITFKAGKKGCSPFVITEAMLFNIFGFIDSDVSTGKLCVSP